jgi:ABC-type transporter Mla MlaB component
VEEKHTDEGHHVALQGSATFLSLTKLTNRLEAVPGDRAVHLDLKDVHGIDHTTAEMLGEWIARRRRGGSAVRLSGPDPVLKNLAA